MSVFRTILYTGVSLGLCIALSGCIEDSASEMDPQEVVDAAPQADARQTDGAMVQPDQSLVQPDMAVTPPPPMQARCGNEDDLAPNQDPEQAAPIEFGFTRNDLFICPDRDDWFRIQLPQGQQISIRVEADPVETDLDLALLDGDGMLVAESTGEEGNEQLNFVSPTAGEYFIRVDGYRDQAAFYALTVTGSCRLDANCPEGQVCDRFDRECIPLPAPECGVDDNEPNNDDTSATDLGMAPTEATGTICGADRDWFGFEAAEGDSFDLLISFPEGEDMDVHVINADTGAVIERATGDRRTNPERLSFSHLPAGSYRVGLTLFIGEDDRDHDVDYTVEFIGRSGACETDRDCTANGLPICREGICQPVEPGAALGERCGVNDDCIAEADLCYTGSTGGHDNYCTVNCRQDGDCRAVGDGAYCVPVSRNSAICVPGCGSDDDCGIFYECQEGRCDIRGPCRVDGDCSEGEICRSARTGERYCGLPTRAAECGADPMQDPNNQRAEATRVGFGETIAGLNICNADDDWYRVAVPEENGGWLMQIGVRFRAGVDIDVYVYDDFGNLVGSATSPDEVDEVVETRFIAPGSYYVRIDQFSSDRLVDTEYELRTALVDNDERCTADGGECARTEPLRFQCDVNTGGCSAIEGGGEVPLGGWCDSSDDCTDDAEFCWSWEGGGRNICTVRCSNDNDCAGVEGTECVSFRGRFAACLPPQDNGGGN